MCSCGLYTVVGPIPLYNAGECLVARRKDHRVALHTLNRVVEIILFSTHLLNLSTHSSYKILPDTASHMCCTTQPFRDLQAVKRVAPVFEDNEQQVRKAEAILMDR